MHHTWRELRDRGDGVVIHFTTFTDGRVAATNGNNAIWLDRDLIQVEQRCTAQHEQAHSDLRRKSCAVPKEDAAARA